MTRILTLLDDILSSSTSWSKDAIENISRDNGYLKSVRVAEGKKGEREREREGNGGKYEKSGKRHTSQRENGNCEDIVKPMTVLTPLSVRTLGDEKGYLLVPKQEAEDPIFLFNTVKNWDCNRREMYGTFK